MKSSLVATPLLLVVAGAVLEIPIVKRDRHTHGRTADVAKKIARRDGSVERRSGGTLETTLFSGIGFVSGGAYYANITIGTPPQLLTVLVDTGSSDLYIDSQSACPSPNSNHPCLGGTFVPSSSSTLDVLPGNTAFNATYGDGSRAVGPYATDVVCINDICVDNIQFGLPSLLDSTVGPTTSLMGVGSYVIEATREKYPNIPWALADAGVINSRLYSLYLNDYDDLTGSILFGGIDTDKYTGTLQTTDTLPDLLTGYVDQFVTVITAVKTNVGGNTKSIFTGGASGAAAYKKNTPSLPVLLDSGSSAWSVPQEYYESIVKQFPYVNPRTGVGSCKNAKSGDSVIITVQGVIDITVDISNFFLPLYNAKTNKPEYIAEGEQACGFEIVPSEPTGEGFGVMGDAMLRSMYVVYDLDLGQLSIAQANPGSSSSNIVAVEAGLGGVAKAAGSNGKSAPANTYSIAPSVSLTSAYRYSTANSAVGTATGLGAIPSAAQVSGQAGELNNNGGGSSGGSSSSSSSSGTGSTGGATGTSSSGSGTTSSHGAGIAVLPPMKLGGLGSAAAALTMMLLGAALVL